MPPGAFAPPESGALTTGRRLAWARWVTDADARARRPVGPRAGESHLAASFWHGHRRHVRKPGHQRRGAVASGVARIPGGGFVAAAGASRHMHRAMLGSAAYRQASALDEAGASRSIPTIGCCGGCTLRRLDAEALRDAMLAISGAARRSMGGPYVPTSARRAGRSRGRAGRARERTRRSLYLQQRRTQTLSLLGVFDSPSHRVQLRPAAGLDDAAAIAEPAEFPVRASSSRSSLPRGWLPRPATMPTTRSTGASCWPMAASRRTPSEQRPASFSTRSDEHVRRAEQTRERTGLDRFLPDAAGQQRVSVRGVRRCDDDLDHPTRRASPRSFRARDASWGTMPARLGGLALAHLLAGQQSASAGGTDLQAGRVPIAAQGQERDLPVSARRAEPDGSVRSQAGARTSITASRIPAASWKSTSTSRPGNVLGSPFKFAPARRSAAWSCASCCRTRPGIADDITLVRSMNTESVDHEAALRLIHIGQDFWPGMPTWGSWVTYALGTENQNLPAYVVLSDPGGLPVDGDTQLVGRLAAGRLPGHAVSLGQVAGAEPANARGTSRPRPGAISCDFSSELNRAHLERHPENTRTGGAAGELRNGRAHADRRARRARHLATKPKRRSSCTGSIDRRHARVRHALPAGPAAGRAAACGSCRSS